MTRKWPEALVVWCHTCRVEYPFELDACPECDGIVTDAPAPERRTSAIADHSLVFLTRLPAEQALVAAGRLDAGGIPNALRDAGSVDTMDSSVDVLVHGPYLSMAKDVLRGRKKTRRSTSLMYGLIATGIALFLSTAILISRWFFTGTPLPR